MKKETKVVIMSYALLCSVFAGGVALEHHYNHMPRTGRIQYTDGTLVKEITDFRDGTYEEKIPAMTYFELSTGELKYYAPEGYELVCDSNGEYTCVRKYKTR